MKCFWLYSYLISTFSTFFLFSETSELFLNCHFSSSSSALSLDRKRFSNPRCIFRCVLLNGLIILYTIKAVNTDFKFRWECVNIQKKKTSIKNQRIKLICEWMPCRKHSQFTRACGTVDAFAPVKCTLHRLLWNASEFWES